MKFIPAGEIIGDAHQVRAVTIAKSPQIPDGEYQFVDMYCNDPLCDCRKTMIQVLHNGTNVATINFGWEPHSFYEMKNGWGPDPATKVCRRWTVQQWILQASISCLQTGFSASSTPYLMTHGLRYSRDITN